MIIRPMEPIDAPEMVANGAEWWTQTYLGKHVSYDPRSVLATLERAHHEGLAIVAEEQLEIVGFLCGVRGPCLANHKVIVGHEVFWWVNPTHRGAGLGSRLLAAIESAAIAAGCSYFSMMSMQSHDPERAGRIYESAGYDWTERTYTKDLTGGSNNGNGSRNRLRGVQRQ